ncbi:MAG: DNA-directed RNA polymerase subunit beta, partial [Fidelibacterota bacterium]
MSSQSNQWVKRQSFSRLSRIMDMPNLLDVQLKSFEKYFLQRDEVEGEREPFGLEEVFRNAFPIEDTHRNYVLEYRGYYFGLPKYTPEECLERGVTYSVPLKVKLVLHITDEYDRSKYAHSIEQDVYFGNIPFMTKRGTFIINGAERVIVSQLQRSPGVFFDEHTHPNGTKLYQARVIPFRGSWIDFTTDIQDCLYVIIDRRRKFPVTTLLRALGFSTDVDIFRAFGLLKTVTLKGKSQKEALGQVLVDDVVNVETGEIIGEARTEITEELLAGFKGAGIDAVELVNPGEGVSARLLLNTMGK